MEWSGKLKVPPIVCGGEGALLPVITAPSQGSAPQAGPALQEMEPLGSSAPGLQRTEQSFQSLWEGKGHLAG